VRPPDPEPMTMVSQRCFIHPPTCLDGRGAIKRRQASDGKALGRGARGQIALLLVRQRIRAYDRLPSVRIAPLAHPGHARDPDPLAWREIRRAWRRLWGRDLVAVDPEDVAAVLGSAEVVAARGPPRRGGGGGRRGRGGGGARGEGRAATVVARGEEQE